MEQKREGLNDLPVGDLGWFCVRECLGKEVTTEKGFKGRVIAYQVETWGKDIPGWGNSLYKGLGAESWIVGARRDHRGDLTHPLMVQRAERMPRVTQLAAEF